MRLHPLLFYKSYLSLLPVCRKGNQVIINILSEHGGNLSPSVNPKVSDDTYSRDPMLSQPPPWSSTNGVTLPQNRQTLGHPRLETFSTKETNLCDPIDQIDKKEGDSRTSPSDTNDISHFKSRLSELDTRRAQASQAAKSKLESLQKRLLNILPKLRKSQSARKEEKSYKKFWLCTPNGHLLKLYSYRLED